MKRYDNFFISVKDLGEAKAFLQSIGLHLKFEFPDKGMAAFGTEEDDAAIIARDATMFPDAGSTIWFVVNNVEVEYKSMKEKGVNFLTLPFRIKTGSAVEFTDPSGNRFGITDYTNH
jgi:predicted enzyme related to lactoylglutathione lyase